VNSLENGGAPQAGERVAARLGQMPRSANRSRPGSRASGRARHLWGSHTDLARVVGSLRDALAPVVEAPEPARRSEARLESGLVVGAGVLTIAEADERSLLFGGSCAATLVMKRSQLSSRR
jgi:hypothetical protein